ncbi:MAG: tryptophan--tRNA ligase [Candidatus Omnitrophica bacterium]|nr:tryptophan--tRNA ligase [Candidatus Omnitrophota bacterium]
MKKRIVSGIRPTGKLHLGNFLGALENWKKLQDEDAFFMIADWHALTTEYESHAQIRNYVFEAAIDILASGVSPEECTLFIQSDVKEHAELGLMLSMITPLAWLERNPTYKDQIEELKGKDLHTHGFLGYPVLQAADILLYKAEGVPVGEDQLAHLELTREIARRFNFLYGKLFPEPEALLTPVKKLPGLDGRKMSKSYDNCIYLSDSPEEVRKKIMGMMTDPARKRRYDKGNPDVCPVFYYDKIFNPAVVRQVDAGCRSAELGCVEDKQMLVEALLNFMKPIHDRRKQLENERAKITEILREGARRAGAVAQKTLAEAKEKVGLA